MSADLGSALGLSEAAAAELQRWLDDPRYADLRVELAALVARARAGDAAASAELADAFAGPLPIGTGGRRGPCGPGPNRVNRVVLRETAHGVADAVEAEGGPRSVVIVYDTRRDSRAFARVVADTLVSRGLHVTLVDDPRPTPQLSFLVRRRSAGAGIVISASHNPPGDNGIKIYGPDGAQVLGPRDARLMAAIVGASSSAPRASAEPGELELIGDPAGLARIDEPYLQYVARQGVSADVEGIQVVFTPLHGVGHRSVVPVLERRGAVVHRVERQFDPDGGRFSTVASANPELAESMALAATAARETGADLVLATDPDADRVGALCRRTPHELEFVDGNRLGVLMLDHVLRHADLAAAWVLTTVVTSPLVATLARAHGVEVVDDLLVGFKHHAGMMAERADRTLAFACEESHGYLRGDQIRDKDGAIAALLLTEAACATKRAGRTLFDRLAEIHREHGYHREAQGTLAAVGGAGRAALARLMETWRRAPPAAIAGMKVREIVDRSLPRTTGSATRDLPSDLLIFELEAKGGDRCRLAVRPSGTEPKAKLYALARSAPAGSDPASASAPARIDALAAAVADDARRQALAIMGAA